MFATPDLRRVQAQCCGVSVSAECVESLR